MDASRQLSCSTKLQRKDVRLPTYVVIPGHLVDQWELRETTVIEGSANGFSFGRRTIKAWGKGSDDWFVEFTAPFCRSAQLNVGDSLTLVLRLADTSTPDELDSFLLKSKILAAAWLALSNSERREASEYIRSAKAEATRDRRAALVANRLGGRKNDI